MGDLDNFGTRLRAARKEMMLTQKALADKVGAKHNSVSDWENGKNMPDPDTIVSLCEVLGLDAGYLLRSEPQNASDDEIWELREELRRNPDMRMLFSASKGAKKEHIQAAAAMLNALKGNDDCME
jgi:transcriptional regulator with XRE-family HTH domain